MSTSPRRELVRWWGKGRVKEERKRAKGARQRNRSCHNAVISKSCTAGNIHSLYDYMDALSNEIMLKLFMLLNAPNPVFFRFKGFSQQGICTGIMFSVSFCCPCRSCKCVGNVEGSEQGNLRCHTREKGFHLEIQKFFQLLLFVKEGNVKRSTVFLAACCQNGGWEKNMLCK